MKKEVKVALIVAVVAVGAYLAWRWYRNRQENQSGSPTGSLGANLNSVAPELVGGSSGPSAGPAVAMPLNITLTEAAPAPQDDGDHMKSHHHGGKGNPVHRQRHHASGDQPNPGGLNIPPGVGDGTPQPVFSPGDTTGTGAGPYGGGIGGVDVSGP